MRGQSNHRRHVHAASGLGLLHGLAGASHLLAVIPALALPAHAAIGYLIAYLLGSIGAMLAVVAVVSFLTQRSGARLLPLLVGGTGALSILTGAIWLQKPQAFCSEMFWSAEAWAQNAKVVLIRPPSCRKVDSSGVKSPMGRDR